MKTKILSIALLLSLTASAQLQKKNQKIDQIARTLTSVSLGSTVLDGDTTFHIVYKNCQYPALNDFKGISFQNRADINAFLWSLLEVVTTGERLDEYTYQNMTATYRIVKGHSNVIIYSEDNAFFYMTQPNIENFISKLQEY